ncbi:MAG: DUF4446 family protein, partial [Candidatus Nealsonbacteria bacterium]
KKEIKKPKDMKEVLKELDFLDTKLDKVIKELTDLKKDQKFSIQKIGLIRFNPFKEVGGDQSFTLALLDKNNSGIAVTSLYSREGNRVYGKSIDNGTSEYVLSEEEKKAIEKAKQSNTKPVATGEGQNEA